MTRITATVHALSAILLILAVCINCANVVGRYVFSAPISSAEEVMLFLLVGVVFLGNSVVAYEGQQIRMDVFLHMLPAAGRYWLELFSDVVTVVLSIILIVLGWPAISMLVEFDQRSQAADIPLAIPQTLIPIGLALSAIFVTIRVIKNLVSSRPSSAAPRRDGLH